VLDLVPSPPRLIATNLSLRDYQEEALKRWAKAGMKGCIVLPTGSGKTVIGVKAIEKVNAPTLVVVPTLDLMAQWTEVLSKYFADATGSVNLTAIHRQEHHKPHPVCAHMYIQQE